MAIKNTNNNNNNVIQQHSFIIHTGSCQPWFHLHSFSLPWLRLIIETSANPFSLLWNIFIHLFSPLHPTLLVGVRGASSSPHHNSTISCVRSPLSLRLSHHLPLLVFSLYYYKFSTYTPWVVLESNVKGLFDWE